MRITDNLTDRFDIVLFLSAVLIVGLGLSAVYSSTINHPTAVGNFDKQLMAFLISLGLLFFIMFLPKQIIRNIAIPYYVVTVFFLVVVLVAGKTVYGAKSWLGFGSFGFQPSEFAKGGVILLTALWLSQNNRDINSFKDVFAALAIAALPVILILLEPDMGSSIIFMVIWMVMIFWAGINLFWIFVVISPGFVLFSSLFGMPFFIIAMLAVLGLLFFFRRNIFNSAVIFSVNLAAGFLFDVMFKYLKPHQQKRIITFLDPGADPLGAGYNAIQAKVAIGSGGLTGKGFLQGNQTQLRFIPEQWTDFIFCVIGEEFGFIGSFSIIILYLIIMLRMLKLATSVKDRFSSLVVIGILSLFFTHFSINVGMNLGLMPVIGVPLPFMSYGGSAMLSNLILLGIVLNIYRNRKQFA